MDQPIKKENKRKGHGIRKEMQKVSAEEDLFPQKKFHILKEYGFLTTVLPATAGGEALGIKADTAHLLKKLMFAGSIDLSLGRLYEGHINALLLIDRYGSQEQRDTYFAQAQDGAIFGVWNTDAHQDPVKLITDDPYHLSLTGKKIFCSGGFCIQRPIITAYLGGRPQMIVIHNEDLTSDREDATSWNPMGMKGSRSTTINFSGCTITPLQVLGQPGNYVEQPYFSTGAVRFAAVQLGGAEAMAQAAFSHLLELGRHEDAIQKRRIGKITILLESGRNWIRETGRVMDSKEYAEESKVNHANMVRTAILDICTEVMHLTEKAVGLRGMLKGHDIERLHRDLSTYLKQPGPDLALSEVGNWTFQQSQWDGIYD